MDEYPAMRSNGPLPQVLFDKEIELSNAIVVILKFEGEIYFRALEIGQLT
jgi:hypothetical protein